MDAELDQVLCTVLSLEEDYPALSPPMRSQDNLSCNFYSVIDFSSVKETPECLHHSYTLQQAARELYFMFGIRQESQIRIQNQNVSNKSTDVTSSVEPRENRQSMPSKSRCLLFIFNV